MPDINLSPYTAESAAIAQRMRMAELLNQQAMSPMEVPQQAGVKISPYAGLAKLLQGYTAGMMQNKALASVMRVWMKRGHLSVLRSMVIH